MDAHIPDYCQVMEITASDGSVKQLLFPKSLDLDRPKRPRTTFSDRQLRDLEHEFQHNPYLVGKARGKLAADLGLSETQVKVWFQNRRTKTKRSPAKSSEKANGKANGEPDRQRAEDTSDVNGNTCTSKQPPFSFTSMPSWISGDQPNALGFSFQLPPTSVSSQPNDRFQPAFFS